MAGRLAASHPDELKRMRDHYEKWWAGVEPLLAEPVPVLIGADQENPVTLSAADWWNVYCDNMNDLRSGKPTNSNWNIQVAKDGLYEFALRRWPQEADAGIAVGVPEFKAVDGGLQAGKALPITSLRLQVGGELNETRPVPADAKEVTFAVKLKAGTRLPVQSYCYDASGKELCGAYFTYVTRK